MWANTVWGFIGLGVSFAGLRLGMLWVHGYEWIAPYLTGASIVCFVAAVIVFFWPKFRKWDSEMPTITVIGHQNTTGNNTTIRGDNNQISTVYNYAETDSSLILKLQIPELKELQIFLGLIDETKLRSIFDIHQMFELNLEIAQKRILEARRRNDNVFDMTSYLADGNEMRFDSVIAGNRLTKTPAGYNYNPDPYKVAILVLTRKHTTALAQLKKFKDSAALPNNVVLQVVDFYDAICKNVATLQATLNEFSQAQPDALIHEKNQNSEFFGSVNASLCDKIISLQPYAEKIIKAIRSHLDV